MSCQCGHQPWDHITVTYPTYSRPCDRLICCDKPEREHEGLNHSIEYCPCQNLQIQAAS